MPTYDYQCDACEHLFEIYQGINDEKLTKCPQCKKKKLRRLLGTGAAVVFKGSGFYQTDYRSESYKKAAAADKPADKSEKKSSGDSSSSKPTGGNSSGNSSGSSGGSSSSSASGSSGGGSKGD